MSKLTKKEKLFCFYYRLTGNHREAAALSGYNNPEKTGVKLISTPRIETELKRTCPPAPNLSEIEQGLRRLAFGSIADAIHLLYADELPKNLDSMDLFCISEIKRPKAGGMEIKFFDRIKALEQLARISTASRADSAVPFYMALEKSARGLFSDGGDDYGI